MKRLSENKIVLVVRETRLDELVVRYNTLEQVRFYIEHLGADFSDYLQEHDTYKRAVAVAETGLRQLGRVQLLQRRFLPNFVFGADDTVVVLGQDGLVANTLKYLSGQPVVGVNPDPRRWDGVLLPFRVEDLGTILPELFAGRRRTSDVTMACAELTDGQTLYAVNDLFIGARSHVSARYAIAIGGQRENHSSSGIIVSTGLGSSGWLRSVLAGATGIASRLTGERLAAPGDGRFAWDARRLCYSVREPFPSNTTGTELIFGEITPGSPLELESQMAGNGVIFSDGIERDFLAFNSGMKASIGVADRAGQLVV